MKLGIIIVATKNYNFALKAQARHIKQNLLNANMDSCDIILVTCKEPIDDILENYNNILGDKCKVSHIALGVDDNNVNYKEQAQLVIAQLYTAAFDRARLMGLDYVWTLESDIIPDANNLRCMIDALNFDNHYYDIAFCVYVSQGGGGIMGGFGNDNNHILPTVYPDEKLIPKELEEKIKTHRELLKPNEQPTKDWTDEMQHLNKEIEKCEPLGNVFTLNGKRWRQRGWLDAAYPGIGKGSIVPSKWMPQGNNLYSQKAINLSDYLGYQGLGTQDLAVCFRRLRPNGIKICVLPHCLSHHIIRENGEYKLMFMRHESNGECEGHLRFDKLPWYSHEPGEKVIKKEYIEDYSI